MKSDCDHGPTTNPSAPNGKPAQLAAAGQEGVIETPDYRGVLVLAAYRVIPITGWVFLEGRTVNVPDAAQDSRWKPEPEHEATFTAGRVTSILIVPLIVSEKKLGVLGVVNKVGAPAFTASDQSLLTTLAAQMAIAIENARLYEDVRGLSIAAIRSLATAIDARDPYTRGHSDDVARLAVAVAQAEGLSEGWRESFLEGILHR